MLVKERSETLFEYWISFWPVAPMFGVRWRFADATPADWMSAGARAGRVVDEAPPPTSGSAAPLERALEAAQDHMAAADVSSKPPAEEAQPEASPLPTVDPSFDRAEAQALMARPAALYEAPPKRIDDLKRIRGVGPRLETMLNEMGVYTFEQIASFNDANLAWVDANLTAFRGRPFRDDWIEQARELTQA